MGRAAGAVQAVEAALLEPGVLWEPVVLAPDEGRAPAGTLSGGSLGWPGWSVATEAARGAEAGPVAAAVWEKAFAQWLAEKAPNTQRAYERAWDDLRAYAGKEPWEMLSADLQEWAEDLAGRAVDRRVLRGLKKKGRRAEGDGRGLSPSTIALWLSAISSFYRFVTTRYLVRTPDGGERPLHGYNPALTIRRPDVSHYAHSDYLDSGDLARLLRAIPRDTVAGLRDYALFLGYVLTGRRNGEWRRLRWGDLRARGAKIYYTWRGKNTDQARNELPPPVWDAILAYLGAAGRLEGMGADDYVFTPLSDNATRLPNVSEATWDANRPLTGAAVNRSLKKYARRAGLERRRVHVHVLRHSAAMLEEELGTSLTRISEFLGHADPKTTMRYLRHLRGDGDERWRGKVARLGLADAGNSAAR